MLWSTFGAKTHLEHDTKPGKTLGSPVKTLCNPIQRLKPDKLHQPYKALQVPYHSNIKPAQKCPRGRAKAEPQPRTPWAHSPRGPPEIKNQTLNMKVVEGSFVVFIGLFM